jgi:lipopolysaccharide/colanic/teichoic acid biosynthesis glycosyltransferase
MDTLHFNPKQSTPAERLSLSGSTATGQSVAPDDLQKPVPQLGQGAPTGDQFQTELGKNPKNPAGSSVAGAESCDIPSWKRILDVTCILLSLPFWLPMVAVVMLWIKIVSPGPIFFRQGRVGFRGRPFMVFKFRTMKVNAETGSHERHLKQLMEANCPMTKLDAAGDPRIIPGGGILRATGLDELAQLFNVLRGEMTLVGPRPCTPHEFQHYQAWQRERVCVQPGLTGYWQVNGKNKTTFTEMVQMDIFYAKNMSLWLDLWIMLRTPAALVEQLREALVGRRTGIGPSEKVGKDRSAKPQTPGQSTAVT